MFASQFCVHIIPYNIQEFANTFKGSASVFLDTLRNNIAEIIETNRENIHLLSVEHGSIKVRIIITDDDGRFKTEEILP